jgi:hypothetical protein
LLRGDDHGCMPWLRRHHVLPHVPNGHAFHRQHDGFLRPHMERFPCLPVLARIFRLQQPGHYARMQRREYMRSQEYHNLCVIFQRRRVVRLQPVVRFPENSGQRGFPLPTGRRGHRSRNHRWYGRVGRLRDVQPVPFFADDGHGLADVRFPAHVRGQHRHGHSHGDSMTWQEALEVVISRTRHERYRWLCSDDNPTHEGHRQLMLTLASAETSATPAGRPDSPTAADLALRDHLGRHGCCGG